MASSTLRLSEMRATGLRAADKSGTSDPYVIAMMGTEKFTSKHVNPVRTLSAQLADNRDASSAQLALLSTDLLWTEIGSFLTARDAVRLAGAAKSLMVCGMGVERHRQMTASNTLSLLRPVCGVPECLRCSWPALAHALPPRLHRC